MYKKGQFVIFETGSYSDKYIIGLFKVLKDFDFSDTAVEIGLPTSIGTLLKKNRNLDFIDLEPILTSLIIKGYLKEINCTIDNIDNFNRDIPIKAKAMGII